MMPRIYALILLISITLPYPLLAHGYASKIKFSDCDCRWDKSELIVWMDNEVEFKYTKIAMDAIDAWENNFDRLSYKIYTLPPDEYDIRITIHKMYGNAVGLPKETIAFTTNEKGGNGELIHAAIDLSVYYRNTYGSISSVSDRVFYNMVLHEFGHAIGLGHAIDNGKEPVDPMHHSLLINEDKRQVSKLDVLTLKSLYK
jgi:hypothetical protein